MQTKLPLYAEGKIARVKSGEYAYAVLAACPTWVCFAEVRDGGELIWPCDDTPAHWHEKILVRALNVQVHASLHPTIR